MFLFGFVDTDSLFTNPFRKSLNEKNKCGSHFKCLNIIKKHTLVGINLGVMKQKDVLYEYQINLLSYCRETHNIVTLIVMKCFCLGFVMSYTAGQEAQQGT